MPSISKDDLIVAIQLAQEAGPQANENELYQRVSEIMGSSVVSADSVKLQMQEYGLLPQVEDDDFDLSDAFAAAFKDDEVHAMVDKAMQIGNVAEKELKQSLAESQKLKTNQEPVQRSKRSREVSKEVLIIAIAEAEKDGPLKNLSVLYAQVAESFNDPKITKGVIKLRIEAWKLPIKTKPGKIFGAEIDKQKLIETIAIVEKDGALPNLAALYNKIVEELKDEYTPAFIKGRIDEWKLKIQTQPGKRGGAGFGKRAIEVDKNKLVAAIEAVEKDGPLEGGLGALYKSVSEIMEISTSLVKSRIDEWELPIKTQPLKPGTALGLGKKAIEVDKNKLIAAIETVEKNGPVEGGLSSLYKSVSEIMEISWSLVKSRIEQWELPLKTQGEKRNIEVDKDKLIAAINKAEEHGPVKGALTGLYKQVADIMGDVSPHIVKARIEQWELPLKTEPGRVLAVDKPPAEQNKWSVSLTSLEYNMSKTTYLALSTPANNCPVKLKGIDAESIRQWVDSVQAFGARHNRVYLPQALTYWLRLEDVCEQPKAFESAKHNLLVVLSESFEYAESDV